MKPLLNTWESGLSPERSQLIRHWSLPDKKGLYQLMHNVGPLSSKQKRVLERIALAFFKSVKPKDEWKTWMGEHQLAQSYFEERQKVFEAQKAALKEKLQGKSCDVEVPLKEEEIDQILCQYFKVVYQREKWSSYSLTELLEIGKKGVKEGLSSEKSLALASLVLQETRSITPYDIQLIAVLSILLNKGGKGRLAQVKTGEGKTMIITLLAFVLVMQGRSVDIVSSSQYLAMRDQKNSLPFFNDFEILTSHICEGEKEINYDAHILYGKATDYEFALMREKVNQKKIFQLGRRTKLFDCVIVDEVDNMLIDTASSSARISLPSQRESKQEYYSPIYAYVKQNQVHSLYGLKGYFSSKGIQKPPFSDEELLELISSAKMAMAKEEGVDYVLQTVDDPRMGKKFSVKIIDHEITGQILDGMRWDRRVHEFLEVKHGIELDQETMTPISLSHAIYYTLYQNIYGFSGTLGSQFEREHVQTTYGVDLFDLPRYRPSQRVDLPIVRCESLESLRGKLMEKTRGMQVKRRPVLILCRSIKETGEISASFHQSNLSHQLYNEMQEEDGDVVIQKGGEAGVVTVSTNNAGRGTDIVLSQESREQGGLHVIFTYYPSSKRVEDQGIGRGGRQGEPGSSEILVVTKSSESDLSAKRLENEKEYAKRLTEQARCERAVQGYVDQFWKKITEWKKRATSGESIEKAANTLFPQGGRSVKFIVEERLLKVEQEVFQRWSESFLEPSEQLLSQLPNGFDEALKQLYNSNKDRWESLFKEEGWRNLMVKVEREPFEEHLDGDEG